MATNFSSLRSSRQAAIQKLNDEIKKENTTKGDDARFWKLAVDQKTKIGFARLRFLPAPKGEDVPWQRIFSHNFKFNGSWFIENCPTTLGSRPCPVCKDNTGLWNSGNDDDKAVVRERKRTLRFVSNILVIEDPSHPENNGKVFLFRYGKKIHDKIQELINPQFPDQQPSNPFDMWDNEIDETNTLRGGADFKLKAQMKEGYQNYDKSEFTDPKELFPGDDQKKEEVWDKEYSLLEFVAESQFKNYEDIEKRFQKVLTGARNDAPLTAADAMKQPTVEDAESLATEIDQATVVVEKKAAGRKKKAAPSPAPIAAAIAPAPAEDEDAVRAFFGDMFAEGE